MSRRQSKSSGRASREQSDAAVLGKVSTANANKFSICERIRNLGSCKFSRNLRYECHAQVHPSPTNMWVRRKQLLIKVHRELPTRVSIDVFIFESNTFLVATAEYGSDLREPPMTIPPRSFRWLPPYRIFCTPADTVRSPYRQSTVLPELVGT